MANNSRTYTFLYKCAKFQIAGQLGYEIIQLESSTLMYTDSYGSTLVKHKTLRMRFFINKKVTMNQQATGNIANAKYIGNSLYEI